MFFYKDKEYESQLWDRFAVKTLIFEMLRRSLTDYVNGIYQLHEKNYVNSLFSHLYYELNAIVSISMIFLLSTTCNVGEIIFWQGRFLRTVWK